MLAATASQAAQWRRVQVHARIQSERQSSGPDRVVICADCSSLFFSGSLYPPMLSFFRPPLAASCVYCTCAAQTLSRRRPSEFIFKRPVIHLWNGLDQNKAVPPLWGEGDPNPLGPSGRHMQRRGGTSWLEGSCPENAALSAYLLVCARMSESSALILEHTAASRRKLIRSVDAPPA